MIREVWFRAGSVERRYEWRDGYSRLTAGGMEYPWLTKREAQGAARRRGARAVFYDTKESALQVLGEMR